VSNQSSQPNWITLVAASLSSIAHSQMGMLVGMGVMIGLGSAAVHWDGHLVSQVGYFQLQKIDNRVFKVNSCTGKVEEIPLAADKPEKPTTDE